MLNLIDTSDVKEVIFYTYSKVAIEAKGRIALAQIAFNDGSYVCMIYQAFPDGTHRWRPAYLCMQQDGTTEDVVPMAGGPLMEKLVQIASGAQAFVKARVGPVAMGSTFRVTRENVEIVPNPSAGYLYV
jgi:hypothetical protein